MRKVKLLNGLVAFWLCSFLVGASTAWPQEDGFSFQSEPFLLVETLDHQPLEPALCSMQDDSFVVGWIQRSSGTIQNGVAIRQFSESGIQLRQPIFMGAGKWKHPAISCLPDGVGAASATLEIDGQNLLKKKVRSPNFYSFLDLEDAPEGDFSAQNVDANGQGAIFWERAVDASTAIAGEIFSFDDADSLQLVPLPKIGQTGIQNGEPATCLLSPGKQLVVWQTRNDNDEWRLMARIVERLSGQSVGDDFAVAANLLGSQETPSVACDIDGGFAVAWEQRGFDEDEDQSSDIFVKEFSDGGSSQGEPNRLNLDSNGRHSLPQLVWEGGRYLALWREDPIDGESKIQIKLLDSEHEPLQVNLDEPTPSSQPRFSAQSQGLVAVTWETLGVKGNTIKARFLSFEPFPGGGLGAGAEVILAEDVRSARAARNANGEFLVTWLAGSREQIFAQKLNYDFSPLSSPVLLAQSSAGDLRGNKLFTCVLNDDGEGMVFWPTASGDVFAQAIAPSGSLNGPVFQPLCGGEACPQWWSFRSMLDGQGEKILLSALEKSPGGLHTHKLQRIQFDGTPDEEIQVLNQTSAIEHQITQLPNSDYLVVYRGDGQSGDLSTRTFSTEGELTSQPVLHQTGVTFWQWAANSEGWSALTWKKNDSISVQWLSPRGFPIDATRTWELGYTPVAYRIAASEEEALYLMHAGSPQGPPPIGGVWWQGADLPFDFIASDSEALIDSPLMVLSEPVSWVAFWTQYSLENSGVTELVARRWNVDLKVAKKPKSRVVGIPDSIFQVSYLVVFIFFLGFVSRRLRLGKMS